MFNFRKKLNNEELEQYKLNIVYRFSDCKYEEVINICDLILKFNPDDTDILYDKVRALVKLKKYKEALLICNKILETEPNTVDILENKVISLVELEKFQEAITVFDKIREIEPNNKFAREYEPFDIYLLDIGIVRPIFTPLNETS